MQLAKGAEFMGSRKPATGADRTNGRRGRGGGKRKEGEAAGEKSMPRCKDQQTEELLRACSTNAQHKMIHASSVAAVIKFGPRRRREMKRLRVQCTGHDSIVLRVPPAKKAPKQTGIRLLAAAGCSRLKCRNPEHSGSRAIANGECRHHSLRLTSRN
jgi:hypothetical protein